MTATAALMASAAAVSGLGAFQQSRQQEAMADYNAEVARNNAIQERQWAAAEEARARREARRQQGQSRAAMGASGVEADTGSFLDVLTDDAIESELEALTIRRQGEARARGYESRRSMYRAQASNTRSSRPLSVMGAALQGAGGASGISSMFSGGGGSSGGGSSGGYGGTSRGMTIRGQSGMLGGGV